MPKRHRVVGRKAAAIGAAVVWTIAGAAPAAAHVKWFLDTRSFPLRWDLFWAQGAWVAVLAVALVVAMLAAFWRLRGGRDFLPGPAFFGATSAGRHVIYGLLPAVIAVHAAVPLLYDGVHNDLFAPDLKLQGAAAYLAGLAEIGIALSFLYGGLVRLAAVGLGVLWAAGLALAGFQSMLENALWLGIAIFFFTAGRGPLAVDRFMFPRFEPPTWMARYAVIALRVGLGVSFAVVAFTEKFANLPLAADFLHHYPVNFTSVLGLHLSDHAFILFAGSVELLVGLCLIIGVFTREIIIFAWLPINLTLTYFGVTELVGHLPIYGIMAVLLIWIPGDENRRAWVEALLPDRGRP